MTEYKDDNIFGDFGDSLLTYSSLNLKRKLRVISRNSPLSLVQVKEVFSFFQKIPYKLITVESIGDRNKHISLMNLSSSSDFFTRELNDALIENRADIAIHSAKDLPYPLPPQLELFALFRAIDKTDALVSRNNLTLQQLPLKARVGTSSQKRKFELLNVRPDFEIINIRGTIEERMDKIKNGLIDALVVATCALKRLGMEDRIACILPFKTHDLQGHLAIIGKKDQAGIMKNFFYSHDIRRNYEKVTLVGFGPGNPDLLTLGGHKTLLAADIIFHDDLLDQKFLSKYAAKKIYVGKRKGIHKFHQNEINEMIYQAAISGKKIVRLKGGDPMIFAHGREEIDFLKSRFVKVKVIPGISAGIAFSAYTHIPLTHRGKASSVAFITGHSINEIQMPSADTLIYYMSGSNLSIIAKKLIKIGRREDLPVALIYNVSLFNQKVWYSCLKELQYSVIRYSTPILLVIGEVVSFEKRNAYQQYVLLTGTFNEKKNLDIKTVHTPLIKISKIQNNHLLRTSLKKIKSFDWIIFTSRYGVRYFFEMLNEMKLDTQVLSGIFFASIGKTTSLELKKFKIFPKIESEDESVDGLLNYFNKIRLTGKFILLPRSDKGLNRLAEKLKNMDNKVMDLPVYTNTVNDLVKKVDLSLFQKIFFSSPSGVEAFKQIYGTLPSGIQMVSKGKTTFASILENSL